MKQHISFFLLSLMVFAACKKEKNNNDCYPDSPVIRSIVNEQTTIRQLPDGQFYMVASGTIDTRLIPCNLPSEFQIANLNVTITGETKAIIQPPLAPCCSEGLVIFKITL